MLKLVSFDISARLINPATFWGFATFLRANYFEFETKMKSKKAEKSFRNHFNVKSPKCVKSKIRIKSYALTKYEPKMELEHFVFVFWNRNGCLNMEVLWYGKSCDMVFSRSWLRNLKSTIYQSVVTKIKFTKIEPLLDGHGCQDRAHRPF